ncbi:MAG: hypothetical protein H7Y38_08530 [Armatimonadetes bacterium]|nr:hypothetical protein [Armatimonadota bacterium]
MIKLYTRNNQGNKVIAAALDWRRSIQRLLLQGFPPTPSREAERWQQSVRSIGRRAIPYLEQKLRRGSVGEQYAAISALRALSVDAQAAGYGESMVYEVKRPGEPRKIIKPIFVDEYDHEEWIGIPRQHT